MDSIIAFFQEISDFITSGIYDFFVQAGIWILQKMIIGWLETKLWALKFSWDIASGFISSVGISDLVSQAFSGLPGTVMSAVSFFRIPEGINILLSCGVTRFVLRFVPGGW